VWLRPTCRSSAALAARADLRGGLNVADGHVTHAGVAQALSLPLADAAGFLEG
jgi:alanine dehydrogenase